MNKKSVAGLDALKQTKVEVVAEDVSPPPAKKTKRDTTIFSLHLPTEMHSKLRELSFHERQSMTKILLEGLEKVFEDRGIK